MRWAAGVLIRFGSNDTRTSGAPVAVLFPSPDVLSLKQCAAVSMTVGDNRVPVQAKARLSS